MVWICLGELEIEAIPPSPRGPSCSLLSILASLVVDAIPLPSDKMDPTDLGQQQCVMWFVSVLMIIPLWAHSTGLLPESDHSGSCVEYALPLAHKELLHL